MVTLTDRLSLLLLDDPFVADLANQIGLSRAFDLCWHMKAGVVHQLTLAQVRSREMKKPVFQTVRTRGTEEHQGATSGRVRIDLQQARSGRLEWIDALLRIDLDAIVDDRATPLREISSQDLLTELGDPGTLPALRAALVAQYGEDVTARLFAQLQIVSIEELRRRPAVALRLTSESAPAFDPNDPANQRRVPLDLAIAVVDQLAPAVALESAKLRRTLLEDEQLKAPAVPGLEPKQPYAFVTLFPESAATDDEIPGLTAAELRTRITDLFAGEHMLAHFVTGL